MQKVRNVSENNVTEETLDQFKRAFIAKCAEQQTETIAATYDELSDMTGLSKGAVFKAVEALIQEGFISKTPAASRRFPNKYTLEGPPEVSTPIAGVRFKSGREFVQQFSDLMREIEVLRKRNSELEAMVGDTEIVAKNELPGGMVQLIYRQPDETEK